MKTVALIEDNLDTRLIVGALLEDDFKVVAYASGPEGLESIENDQPDVLILDISLPGMDGAEVLRCLREDERWRNLPVIAFTAHAMSGDREKYLAKGFNDYLTKPILNEDDLLTTVRRWADR